MPSIEESSGDLARPVVFSDSDEHADHRLKSGFVPLITFVVIVAAAAVTAAIVFGGGGQTRSGPPTGIGLGKGSAGLMDMGSRQPATGALGRKGPQSADMAGMAGDSSARGTSKKADGEIMVGSIPLTLDSGWEISREEEAFVVALDARERIAVSIEDVAVESDLTLLDVADLWLADRTEKMDDVVSGDPMDRGIGGKRFPQSAEIDYSGTATNDNGSYEETGLLVVLLNPRTSEAGLINFWTDDPSALETNDDRIRAILESMVN